MKDMNDSLWRLFRAARRAPQRDTELPFGFEARVLAIWKQGTREDDSLWMLMLVRRALVAACVVALLSMALGYSALPEPSQNELTLADSLIKMSLLP